MLSAPNPELISSLMSGLRRGDQRAAGQLVEIFYPELRRIAAARMKAERDNHTWRPTALVNELYLELVKIKALRKTGPTSDAEKQEFLALSAFLMKRLLIHHSRRLSSKASYEELPELASPLSGTEALVQVEDALDRLAAIDPKLRFTVEMRVFEGLTGEEIAARMDCSTATVTRNWSFARRWLEEEFARVPAA
jgi:RNA polymerase sigma factor (TIGR02999 family)